MEYEINNLDSTNLLPHAQIAMCKELPREAAEKLLDAFTPKPEPTRT